MRDYLSEVRRILADHLGVDESNVAPESILNDLGADSLDEVEIVMAFEEEYDIEIPDTDAEQFRTSKTVGDIVAYFARTLEPTDPA